MTSMNPSRDQTRLQDRPVTVSRENPTLLAFGAGLLALIAILVAAFAMSEEHRQEIAVDKTAQTLSDAARQVDAAAQKVVDGLKK